MPTQQIEWADGSGDKIYITSPDFSGNQQIAVSSDPNTGAARSKVVTFSAGNVSKTLTVEQAAGQIKPQPIFKLSEPTTTKNYDTNVLLFDTPKSFTILCDATFNNYPWTARTQGVFGISTGNYFRFGSIANGYDYEENVRIATANRYSAIIMNNTSSGKMCMSLFARSNSSTRRKFAIRYDYITRKIEAFNSTSGTTKKWYIVPGDLLSQDTLKLLIGNASGTINAFEVYNSVLDIQYINDFLSGN